MADDRKRTFAEKLADNDLINAAMTRAVREAKLSHARAGRSVAVCPNDKIIWLTPEQIFAMYAEEPAARPDNTAPSHQKTL
jgi:hypothetical protein